jgi:hypothetical protein
VCDDSIPTDVLVGFSKPNGSEKRSSTSNVMNKFSKIAIVAAGVVLVAQGAKAGFTVNDLYLGFTQSSATSDLILDLGQASSLFGGSSVINLSSDLGGLTTFNSTFNNSPTGVSLAVVGGNNTFGQYGVFATQVRSGGAGDPTVAGSSISATHSSSQMSGGAGTITGLASTTGGLPSAGGMMSDSSKSYSLSIELTTSASSFVGKTGVNPTGTMDSSGVLYEDLYSATTTSPYTYQGFLKFDYNNDSLTFTPSTVAAVPEPSTYSLIGGGILLLLVRHWFGRKTA